MLGHMRRVRTGARRLVRDRCGTLALAPARPAPQTARGSGADLHQGHRADLPGEVRGVPPARFDRADVARHLRRGAAVGALDQGARRRPPDAAVAHRQDRRHAELQERSLADRRADRHDRAVGRRRRAAGRPEGHAGAEARGPTDQGWNFAALFGQKEPDLIVKSHDFTMPAQSQDAWDKRITPSGITEPRWVRAIEIRPTTVKGRKIVHHAIAYLEQDRAGRAERRLRPADAVHGVGGRQAGRDDAARHRQAAAAGLEVPLGHSLLAGG